MTTTANKIDPNDTTTTNKGQNPAYDGSHTDAQTSVPPIGNCAVTDKQIASNVAVLTIPAGHPFVVGDSVVVALGDSIFDGTKTLTAKTATSISYAKTNADVTPGPWTVTNKALASYLATLTIGTHNLAVGDTVTVSGVDSTFNGTFVITAKTSTTISFRCYKADVTSGAGSGTVTRISPIGSVSPTAYNERLTQDASLDVQQPAAVRVLPSTGTVASGARW